jgi:hypothetical protein
MKIPLSAIFFSAICVVAGVIFLSSSWGAYAQYQRVRTYEGKAVGHITGKHFQTGSDGSGAYFVDYWFVPFGGGKISATGSITRQQWEMLKVGDTMEVRFNRQDPGQNIPLYGGGSSLMFAFFMFLLGGVFLFFGVMRLFRAVKSSLPKNKPRWA